MMILRCNISLLHSLSIKVKYFFFNLGLLSEDICEPLPLKLQKDTNFMCLKTFISEKKQLNKNAKTNEKKPFLIFICYLEDSDSNFTEEIS